MDFKKEIKDQVHVEIRKLLDQFAEATDTFTQKSLLLEVAYKTPC